VTGATNSSSAVGVSSGATLGGTGTVAGAVTVNNGATLAPGTGGTTIGTLRTGALTFSTTSVFSVDLSATGPTHDSIYSTGTVTCAGTLTIASLAGTPANGNTYEIIEAASVTGSFAGMADNAIFTAQGRYFQIDYTATRVTITDCALPTTFVWDGGGGDDNWNTALNWSTDFAPSATNDLQFAGSTRLTPSNNYAAATSFGSLTFNAGAGGFKLSGNSITLTGNVTNNSSNKDTIGLNMAIAATHDFATTPGEITVSGIISGAGALTKSGTGTLRLSGNNTYTGLTTINNGVLKLGTTGDGTNTPLGTTAAGTVVNSGGTLDLTGWNLSTAEPLTLNGTGYISQGALRNSGASATFSGLITLGSASAINMNNGALTIRAP
jgi:autotransporter-associated beta strand protein